MLVSAMEDMWDGPRWRFTMTLDDLAIAQEDARLEGPDEPDESRDP